MDADAPLRFLVTRVGRTCAGLGVCLVALGLGFSLPVMHVGLALALVGALLARLPLQRVPGSIPLAAMALWAYGVTLLPALIQGRSAVSSEGGWFAWLIMPVACTITADHRWRRWVVICLALAVTAGGLWGLTQFLVGYDRGLSPFRLNPAVGMGGRASGFFSLHLTQAFILGTVLLVLLQHDRHWRLPGCLGWTARIVITAGFLVAQARAAIAALVLGVLTAAGLRGGRRLLVAGAGGLGLILVAIGGLALFRPELLARFTQHQESRNYIWSVACDACADHPLLGIGGKKAFKAYYREHLLRDHPDIFLTIDPTDPEPMLARYPQLRHHPLLPLAIERFTLLLRHPDPSDVQIAHRKELYGEIIRIFNEETGRAAFLPGGAPHAHSSLLTLAAFYGLPCALLMLLAMLILIRACWRRRQAYPQTAALGISLVVFGLAAGMFEYTAGDSESVYALFLALGLALGLSASAMTSASESASEPGSDQG